MFQKSMPAVEFLPGPGFLLTPFQTSLWFSVLGMSTFLVLLYLLIGSKSKTLKGGALLEFLVECYVGIVVGLYSANLTASAVDQSYSIKSPFDVGQMMKLVSTKKLTLVLDPASFGFTTYAFRTDRSEDVQAMAAAVKLNPIVVLSDVREVCSKLLVNETYFTLTTMQFVMKKCADVVPQLHAEVVERFALTLLGSWPVSDRFQDLRKRMDQNVFHGFHQTEAVRLERRRKVVVLPKDADGTPITFESFQGALWLYMTGVGATLVVHLLVTLHAWLSGRRHRMHKVECDKFKVP